MHSQNHFTRTYIAAHIGKVPQQTGKFLKRWEYQTTLLASWEIYIQVKKQQLEWDMEQQTGSKLGKEYVKAVYCYPTYLTFMQSTPCEMYINTAGLDETQPGIKIARRNINKPHICRWDQHYGRKWRGTKDPLVESERGEWKSWLRTQYSKWHPVPSVHGK